MWPAAFALALALSLACKGDTGGTSAKAAPSAPATNHESAATGDVVIAKAAAPYRVVALTSVGSIAGSIALKGALAPLAPADAGKESAICGPSVPDESVQITGGGLAGVVVWLEGARSGKSLGLERRVELETNKCRLSPRVQAAVTGSAVNIIGHDQFREHLQFSAAGETAPRASILLGGGEQVIPTELPFKAPGMVAVHDADHLWPRAYLAVFDHPYFAVTGPAGTFTIDGIPPGKYTLHAWHERTAATSVPVEVGAGGATKVTVSLEGR